MYQESARTQDDVPGEHQDMELCTRAVPGHRRMYQGSMRTWNDAPGECQNMG